MTWSKDNSGNWLNIEEVDVYDNCFDGLHGICVIFKVSSSGTVGKSNYQVIKTGRGYIRSILDQYLTELKANQRHTGCYVTWLKIQCFVPEFIAGMLDEKLELLIKNQQL